MGNLQITQLFSGAVGCIGFGLIYNLRRRGAAMRPRPRSF